MNEFSNESELKDGDIIIIKEIPCEVTDNCKGRKNYCHVGNQVMVFKTDDRSHWSFTSILDGIPYYFHMAWYINGKKIGEAFQGFCTVNLIKYKIVGNITQHRSFEF